MKVKVLVTGSRKWKDLDRVKAKLEEIGPDIVVHGRAMGADYCAHISAEDMGLTVANGRLRPYPADWERHGSAAGPIRNQQMLDEEHVTNEPIDLCIAYPDANSIGTWDMVERCLKAGIEVELDVDDKAAHRRLAALRTKLADSRPRAGKKKSTRK